MKKGQIFRRVRIAILLGILAIVVLYAVKDVTQRRARTSWKRPLQVAFVVIRRGPVDDAVVKELAARSHDLESHLKSEMERYRDGERPFSFSVYGPVDASSDPPSPAGGGFIDLARASYDSWRYYRDIDQRADVPSAGFDSRIYLVVRPPINQRRKSVEGQSEEGGRIGSVAVELDSSMIDFALFVATHELLHTLGATDKYDAMGRARVPDGLGEPDRIPLYPQVFAEVMARNVALSPTEERPPDTLDELRVGAATAREIGWLPRAQ